MDDTFVVARNPKHLQLAPNVLISLFDRVGLNTTTTKTEGMIFLPGRMKTPLIVEAYEARMVATFWEEKAGQKFTCPCCPTILATGFLRFHLVTQHNAHPCFILKDSHRGPSLLPPTRYSATLLLEDGKWRCPGPNCPQGQEGCGCSTTSNLRWHCAYHHPAQ